MMLSSVRFTSRTDPTRTISIAFSGKRERAVGDRNTHQNERRVRKCACKRGNLSDERDRTGSSEQPNLPIELAHIRRCGSRRRKYPWIRLGVATRGCGAATTDNRGPKEKQSQTIFGRNQHEQLIPYPVLPVSISFAACLENKWSVLRSPAMQSGKR